VQDVKDPIAAALHQPPLLSPHLLNSNLLQAVKSAKELKDQQAGAAMVGKLVAMAG
jgi:hypothetical protein